SSFSASHNSDARVARFRSNIGSVLVSSGSLEGARRRKETMEERTGNVSHRCSRRINPIPNRWIPLIFLYLKKCSLVVIAGRFPGVTVSLSCSRNRFLSTHVLPKNFGYLNSPVRFLVVLENRNDRALSRY